MEEITTDPMTRARQIYEAATPPPWELEEGHSQDEMALPVEVHSEYSHILEDRLLPEPNARAIAFEHGIFGALLAVAEAAQGVATSEPPYQWTWLGRLQYRLAVLETCIRENDT